MNEEYLWDKSGEPDPEIQQLEEILGTLRYQPRELEIPVDTQVGRRPSYLPLLAIAATISVALLAAGLWLRAQSQKVAPNLQQAKSQTLPAGSKQEVPTPVIAKDTGVVPKPDYKRLPAAFDRRESSRNLVAKNIRRARNSRDAAKERELALATKEQLMMAFRVASEKLNLAQRRAQTPAAPANLNRNQHKVG